MAKTSPGAFAVLLRQYRITAGFTQEELAEQTTLSVRTISDLERGINHRPHAFTVRRLAHALALGEEESSQLAVAARQARPSEEEGQGPHNHPSGGTHLPLQPTPFIGRQREVRDVTQRLERSDVRLLTLTGAGGTGKTRLALQVAGEISDTFPDGVFFVPLASVIDPSTIPSAIATSVGVKAMSGQSILACLHEHLRGKRRLLILDNFEHLLAGADVVAELLVDCPLVKILATSREVLHLSAEHEYPIPPLPVPAPQHVSDVDALARYDAVQLFVQRAEAVAPGFRLTGENAAAIGDICYRLDGLPLALELAAARVRIFSPRALLTRLSNPMHVLTGGAKDRPARQQTLRNTMDWSYSLLSEEERTLFARLSIFVGGCSFEAIEAVCDPAREMDLLALVIRLAEQSLLRMDGDDESRFRMLEIVRDYASEQLEERGETKICRDCHVSYYLTVAEELDGQETGADHLPLLNRLEEDLDNLRAALAWTIESGQSVVGLRLATALERFWIANARVNEGRKVLEDLLAALRPESSSPALRARALRVIGRFTFFVWDHRLSIQLLEESLSLYRSLGDDRGTIESLGWLGKSYFSLGEIDHAVSLYEERIELARQSASPADIARCLYDLVWAEARRNNVERVEVLAEESLTLFRTLGDMTGTANVLAEIGYVAHYAGETGRATQLFQESLFLLRQLPWNSDIRGCLTRLAYIFQESGNLSLAKKVWEESVSQSLAEGEQRWAAHALCGVAQVARMFGDYDRAVELYEESLAIFHEFSDSNGAAIASIGLSDVARDRGDIEGIIRFAERSLALFRALRKPFHEAFALNNLGRAASMQGEYDRAILLLEESLHLVQEIGDRHGIAEILTSIGVAALEQSDYQRAREALSESLRRDGSDGIPWTLAMTFEALAGCNAALGHMERAAMLFGAADTLREMMDSPVPPANERWYHAYVGAAKTALGEAGFEAMRREGRTMGLEQAVTHALTEETSPADLATATRSEREGIFRDA
jgi:predicted ATPase/transcriptional regulator with XRE-family HTH domain